VPDFHNVKAVDAQAAWAAVGFALPVVFNPALTVNPQGGGNITAQSLVAGASLNCQTTAITIDWNAH
jgi:hypothetical protein